MLNFIDYDRSKGAWPMDEFFAQFDRGVDRENTRCHKWDQRQKMFGRADVIPMSVADMDFAAPEALTEALCARARHGAFGYEKDDDANAASVAQWVRARHGLSLELEEIIPSIGVIHSMNAAVALLTRPGDTVIVQPPVYPPFFNAVRENGCTLYRNRLVETASGWRMDMEDLEQGLKRGAKLLLICSPHNPVGRVWKREELSEVCALCARYGARVVCDEIHSDLILPGYEHTPILSVDAGAVMLLSATKSFNLAALRHSSVVIRDPDLRARFIKEADRRGISTENLFGALAQQEAYRHGAPWLDALNRYVDANRRAVADYFAQHLPMLRAARLEGSYLLWLDFRALDMTPAALWDMLIHKAGVGLVRGQDFGEEGAGYMRMNLATPRRYVDQALQGMRTAILGR